MVRQHNGELTLTSKVGVGTTVTIAIPAQRVLPAVRAIA
jgi:signal transduction histidine kinase